MITEKYLLSPEKYKQLIERLLLKLQPDAYGKYTICSLYYDNDNFDLARRSIDKPDYE
ncbi:MAG: VTC domain-containing protein [Clostridia bacterium]|nr:VTC domain-containing protein [Clostridia bacterium]